ncbi:MAG: arginase [Gemmatimonadetes bacterium]|nr:arginase [Gemmatimonadota bacterium]
MPNAPVDAPSETDLPRAVRLIGVPMDLGASRRGVDMGPSAVRLAGLVARLRALGLTVVDDGNVTVPDRGALGDDPDERLQAITAVCAVLAQRTAAAVTRGEIPLVLGGDHSLAMGSVAGTAAALHATTPAAGLHTSGPHGGVGARVGLLWLDAHADINTPESSLSGNVHGMPMAHLLGYGDARLSQLASSAGALFPTILPQHAVYVGLRDLDDAEKHIVRELGIRAFTMRDIDERGLRAVMDDAMTIASTGTAGVHVSCDLDWIDPREAPGVGTPVRGGATLREAHLAMEIIHDSGALRAMDLVEVNPILDHRNTTAELAADLVASAFGRRIL